MTETLWKTAGQPENEYSSAPRHSPSELEALGIDAFVQALAHQPQFRPREGQHRMAQEVARTFAIPGLGSSTDQPNIKRISVIQAGTGVGKSLAYSAPAIAIAMVRQVPVVISTATVALQEQLVNKDLPALASALAQSGLLTEETLRVALAKGRGRYICKFKLMQLSEPPDRASQRTSSSIIDLFPDEVAPEPTLHNRRLAFHQDLAQRLVMGSWDGDRDSLSTPPPMDDWQPVAAEASSCTSRHCPLFSSCTYFEQRKQIANAHVIVVNHDLLLASLGKRLLPELDQCLLVLDEGHHLPGISLDQFTQSMSLTELDWIDKLGRRLEKVGQLLQVDETEFINQTAQKLKQSLEDFARMVVPAISSPNLASAAGMDLQGDVARMRLGQLPEPMLEPLSNIQSHAKNLMRLSNSVAKALKAVMQNQPQDAATYTHWFSQIGGLTPHLEDVEAAVRMMLHDAGQSESDTHPPMAKWFSRRTQGPHLSVLAHASPTVAGATLLDRFWSKTQAVVVTSATLTAQGQFDFFLNESGLAHDEHVMTLDVPSPFDYPRQGKLLIKPTRAHPRETQDFNLEMIKQLLADLKTVQAGALVLFTSREQLQNATAALDASLQACVLVQDRWPRTLLLSQHRKAVNSGQRSIIFGMQSFGEGLDLPGALCQTLFITKLPFASPDDPVAMTRSEWLRTQQLDPFSTLVVPATAMRMAQWVGRAIRTETDQAVVICYDKRLTESSYGAKILRSLPAFDRSTT